MTPILLGVVIALAAATVYLFIQLDTLKTEMAKTREAVLNEIGQLRETSSVSSQTAKRRIEALQDELELARRQATMAVGQAKEDAQKKVEEVARRLESESKRAQAQLGSQISEVKAQTSAAQTQIGEVSKEVGSVRTEVASAKSELDKTIADLKRVTGDLGVQSGLIATNGKEIAALRALGERNIYEFRIQKTKQAQKIADILIQLKKSDQKKNRFTIDVVADDKRVEKKDKYINEPLQFYTLRARQPYEIVVNEVGKDLIVGYLSTPKVMAAR
jgi:chromosome segregation ATPase